jgi:hypothetical protein
MLRYRVRKFLSKRVSFKPPADYRRLAAETTLAR